MPDDLRYRNWLRVREPSEPTFAEVVGTCVVYAVALLFLLGLLAFTLAPEPLATIILEGLK